VKALALQMSFASVRARPALLSNHMLGHEGKDGFDTEGQKSLSFRTFLGIPMSTRLDKVSWEIRPRICFLMCLVTWRVSCDMNVTDLSLDAGAVCVRSFNFGQLSGGVVSARRLSWYSPQTM